MKINNINGFSITIDDEVLKGIKYFDITDYTYHLKNASSLEEIERVLCEDIGEIALLYVPITYGGINNRIWSLNNERFEEIHDSLLDEPEYKDVEDDEEREYRIKSDALYFYYDELVSDDVWRVIESMHIS